MQKFDLAVVGAGILDLAHALAAVRRGKRVVVVDRDARANGASIRNFGFITVTGQERGITWRRAMRSRDVWAEVAPQAGIRIEQEGFLLIGRWSEAEWAELPAEEQAMRRDMAHGRMKATGADWVIDSVADLMPVIDAIELRLDAGERPEAKS